MTLKKITYIATLILIPIVIAVLILVFDVRKIFTSNPLLEKKSGYILQDLKNNRIVFTDKIFDDSKLQTIRNFKKIYYSKNGHILARAFDDQLLYLKINNKGEIIRYAKNDIQSDIDATGNIEIFENGENTYLIYLFPHTGIRLITLDKDNKFSTKLFFKADSYRFYTNNEDFISENKIYIPNGTDTKNNESYLSVIDILSETMSTNIVSTQACGVGNWEMFANTKEYFAFENGRNTCILNVLNNTKIFEYESDELSWYKTFPEKNILITEDFSLVKDFPNSKGVLHIYDMKTKKENRINVNDKELFKKENLTSAGGFTLLDKSFYDPSNDTIYLFSQGSQNRIETGINLKDYQIKDFMISQDYAYWNVFY
jgi:hypothetical protein